MSRTTETLTPELQAYLLAHNRPQPDDVLRDLADETASVLADQADMQIAPEQGAFMTLLTRLVAPTLAVEVGTFTGYSSLAVALVLPDDGHIVCCDVSEEWTSVARRYWAEAGVDAKIDLRLAPATETLDGLLDDGLGSTYDFAFIDADKKSYDAYYERALRLVRPGGLIAVDNTLWAGRVVDPEAEDADTRAIQAFNAKLAGDERVSLCLLPVADGVTLARRR